MITAGVDVGAKYVKVVIREAKVLGREKGLVGFDILKSATDVFEVALKKAGLSRNDIEKIVATGMGGEAIVNKPPINADETVSVVIADAAGAFYVVPTVKTVVDVGAEEGRGVKVDEGGKVRDFVINERCAAGAGTFVETMSRALEVKLEDMGPLALKSTKTVPMNAQCCVFAESEVVSLIHSKVAKEDISRAIHDAMASRIGAMVLRVGVEKDVVLIGGVALNPGFLKPLEKELNTEIIVPEFPEYIGALGAALLAAKAGR